MFDMLNSMPESAYLTFKVVEINATEMHKLEQKLNAADIPITMEYAAKIESNGTTYLLFQTKPQADPIKQLESMTEGFQELESVLNKMAVEGDWPDMDYDEGIEKEEE